jgi:hypothetical protein
MSELMEYKTGVLFIVTGEFYTQCAIKAAYSVAKSNPSLPIAIFSDQTVTDPVFASIGHIDNPHIRSKLDYLNHSPFEQTLYLDSDVRVVGGLEDLFRLLERFELAAAHVRYRFSNRRLRIWNLDLPRSFPQLNCGVLLYRNSPDVKKLFADWSGAFHANNFKQDQFVFRELLWLSPVRFYVFGPEYNTRSLTYGLLPSKIPQPVILHLKGFHSRKRIGRFVTRVKLFPTRLRAWMQRGV